MTYGQAFALFQASRRDYRHAGRDTCFYCEQPFSNIVLQWRRTIDHKIPVSRGGSNDPSNRVWACYGCNQNKAWLTDREFIEWTRGIGQGMSRSTFLITLYEMKLITVPMRFSYRRDILTGVCDRPLI